MILGLGLGSCQKNSEAIDKKVDDSNSFIYNDEVYLISEVQIKFGKILGIDPHEFTFSKDSLGFWREGYPEIYKIEPVMDIIKRID